MPKSYADIVREVRGQIREVTPAQVAHLVADRHAPNDLSAPLFVDVRERYEWEEGHIPGAVHVPRGNLEAQVESTVPARSRPLIVYCAGGWRSALATKTLAEMGYSDVVNVAGGFQLWKTTGLPWVKPTVLSAEQKRRYSRHLLIPEVGLEGQARLLGSKALLIGAGGLGSPAALYLAAAGVGTIGIVDFDVVDESNLQRQVVHATDRIGVKKTESAAVAIRALNPDVRVVGHDEMLTEENVERLIADYDVILDGTDTFETRYTVNDAAVRLDKTVIHASVFRFEGQLTVFTPFAGPCYRCLYPTPPPPELAPGCSVAGVLGVVPGIMGLLQTNEALKVLLGIGDTLAGRLLIFDALDGTFRELRLRRDPACPACGEKATGAREAVARETAPATPVPAAVPAAEAAAGVDR